MAIRLNRKSLLALAIASVAGAATLSLPARADVVVWSNTATTTNWSTAANWVSDPGHNPPLSTDMASFNSSTAYAHAPNVDVSTSIDSVLNSGSAALTLSATAGQALTIAPASSSNGITVLAGAGVTTISTPVILGASQTWTNGSANTLTVGTGAITGGGFDLTVTNSGTSAAGLTVSGASTNLGNLTVNNNNSGTGAVTMSGAMNGTGALTVSDTANIASTTANLLLSGAISGFSSASFSNAATGATNTSFLSITSAITNVSTLTFSNTNANTGTLTSTGILSGSGTLTVNGTGNKNVSLTGAINGYTTLGINDTGAGTLSDSGVILGSGSGTFTINANGLSTVSGAINGWDNVNINNNGASAGLSTVSSLIAGGGGLAGVGNLSISNTNSSTGSLLVSGTIVGTGTLSVSNSTLNATTLSSQISGFSSVNVTAGVGDTVTFSGGYINTYNATTTITGGGALLLSKATTGGTGATVVSNGTLQGGIANAFASLGVVTLGGLNTNGVIDLAGFSQQVGGLADGASGSGTETIGNSSATAAATLTVNTSLGDSTFGGVIQNVLGAGTKTVALTKTGLGTLNLTGVNMYSGNTAGNQGTINFVGQAAGSTQNLGALSFTSGGLVIESTYGGGGNTNLNFTGTLGVTTGATADFVINGGVSGTTNTITVGTATTAANAILGTWAFFGTGAATQYAVQSVGVLGGYTSGNVITDANAMTTSANNATGNYELSLTGTNTLTGNATAYSVRYTGTGQTIDTNGNTLTANGIINASSGTLTFANTSAGGVAIGSSGVLVLNAASGNIEFANTFNYLQPNSYSLTIAGPNQVIFDQGITNNSSGNNTLTLFNGSSGAGAVVIGPTPAMTINAASGSIVINNPIVNSGSGSSSVTIDSTSPYLVRLTGANSFTGGLTVTTGSTLDVTNASNGAALGAGTFTLQAGSTLSNSSTGTFTNTLTNNMVWAGDFTLSGTSGSAGLNLGNYTLGKITLAPDAGNVSGTHILTLTDNNASTLTLGSIGDGGLNVGLTKTGGAGGITLAGFNTFTGALTINNGSVSFSNVFNINSVNPVFVNAGATLGLNSQVVYFAGLGDSISGGGGLSSASSSRAFNLLGSDSFNTTGVNNTYAFSGVIGSGNPTDISLIKGGSSTQYLTGKNLYTVGTTINSGALILDFTGLSTPNEAAGATPITNILYNGIANGGALGLGGGTLGLIGGSVAATNYSQSFSTVGISGGGSTVQLTANGGDSLLLNWTGAVTRSAGATVNFILPTGTQTATNGIRTIALTTNGILGGYAVVNGADWAATGATAGTYNVAAYTGYTNFIGAASVATSNYLISPGVGAGTGTDNVTANETFNSLKIAPSTSGQILTINAATTLTLTTPGGLLFTGNNDYTIAGANATTSKLAAAGLVVQQYAAGNNLTIGAIISGSTLTKSGPGTLTLTNANTITGTITLNAGITSINTLAALGTGAGINFNGGTLRYATGFTGNSDITLTTAAAARQVNFGNGGATIDTNGINVTFANANSFLGGQVSGGTAIGYYGGFTKTGAGTLTISNAASYYGPTVISGGVLSIGTGTLPMTASLTEAGGTSTSGGTITGLSSVSGIFVGEIVTGISIPVAQIVTAVNTSNNTVSTNTAQAGGGNPVTFGGFAPLADGGPGISSSIGLSDSAAQNLVLDSGTLQYTGPATSSNRLFTVTQNGGGLDASGTGAVTFSSPGAIAFTGAGNRTLTLTGSNTGDNTLNPVISNPTTGNTLLTKSGGGTWVLTAAETYTGATTITGGTLKLAAASNNIASSTQIIVGVTVGDGSVLDVNGITGGFVVGAQTLTGADGTVKGNTEMDASSTFLADLSLATPATPTLNFVGDLALDPPSLSFSGLADGTDTYVLATYTGNLTGSFDLSNVPAGYTIDYGTGSNSEISIVPTGVPEPASLCLLGVGAAGLLLRRRRQHG